MLLFTPELCGADPLDVLERALPHVDAVQVRLKEPALGLAPARATLEWSRRVLELVRRRAGTCLVLVNDRPDVARTLAPWLDGLHLGQDDCPPELARALLGPEVLLGLSTHSAADVALGEQLPVDYLGFGPVHPTKTKDVHRGLGSDATWVAASATALPVFPIGGIDATNAQELARVGRAAVSSAILSARDPARAAREIRDLLTGPDSGLD